MKSTLRWQFPRVIGALVIREMITRYGRSWGGYVWAILEPAGMIGVLAFAFSQIIHRPPIGDSFVLFYATGYVPFHLFVETASSTGTAIMVNRQLMHLPMVTPLDAMIARFLLSLLTFIVVSIVVFGGILLFVEEPVAISLSSLALSLCGGALLGLGMGSLNAVLFAYLPSWKQIWAIISRPLFLVSGVLFTFESLPPGLQGVLWWNPLVHVVGEARKGFYGTYQGDYVSLLYVFLVGMIAVLIGGALIARNQSYIIDVH